MEKSKEPPKTHPLPQEWGRGAGVGGVEHGYVTTYILRTEQGAILLDAGTKNTARKVVDALAESEILPGDVSLILLTHGHTDHFGCARELQEHTGAPIAIHPKDLEFAQKGINPPVTVTTRLSKELHLFMDSKAKNAQTPPCEPTVMLSEGMTLEEFGIDATIYETPGHTPGSVSVVLPDGVAFIGDLVMGMVAHPYIPTWPLFTDDIELTKVSLRKLIDLGSTKFYSAHGGPFDVARVERLIKRGSPRRHRRWDREE